MDWIEVTIFTTSEAIELISGFLYELGITGLLIEDNLDIVKFLENNDKSWDYVDEELMKRRDDESCVKFYLSDDIQGKEKLALVTNGVLQLKALEEEIDLGRLEVKLTNVSEDDWANNWKKYYKPLRIGERIVIKPTWEEYQPLEGDLIIEMDPGMAFGTGTHETTSMCIELLQKYAKAEDVVLDIGCGSGILGITSAMLGAKQVVGVDFDSVAVKVAKENVKNNNLEQKVEIRCGDLMDVVSEKGNIIVANIIADVIIKLSACVTQFSLNDAVFISSGIIKERLEDVKNALLERHFEILEVVQKGEWVAIASRIRE
jgi:ribosomal protein L11 methyltransferase